MHNSTLPAEKTAGTTDTIASTDLPSDALRLGVDEAGDTHYYSRIAQTVVVVDTNGSVARREGLDDRPLQAWLAYVADERGWNELHYVETVADLFERLEVI